MERRTFFKLVGLSTVSLTAGGACVACGSDRMMDTLLGADNAAGDQGNEVVGCPEVSFSSEVDVLVVGSGMAGLSAAMAPAEAQRSVRVVEKLDVLGGESYTSYGIMRVSGSALQRDAGIDRTATEAWDARKQDIVDAGITNLDFAKQLAVLAPDWIDHVREVYGSQFADPRGHVQAGASDTIVLPRNGLGDMESVMMPLRDGLSDKGVTFSTGMRALAFVVDGDGIVRGMRLKSEKNETVSDVRTRCIVMATGGFASSQPLVHTYIPAQERLGCYTYASMGEGHLLCVDLNTQLMDMDKAASLTSDIPQAAAWGMFGPIVVVDASGRRFAREDDPHAVSDACVEQDRGFWWTVFDKQLIDGGQSRSVAQMTSRYAKRLIGPCDTLDDLADTLAIAASVLKTTFDGYDDAVEAGKDIDFGRESFLRSLVGPYYALKQFPVRYMTRGGVELDGEGRLMDTTGSPIDHVYGCGSISAGSEGGLVSAGACGMLVGRAIVDVLDGEDRTAADSS